MAEDGNHQDEFWTEGDVLCDPELAIRKLKEARFDADIFAFSQKTPGTEPRYNGIIWLQVPLQPLTIGGNGCRKRQERMFEGQEGGVLPLRELNSAMILLKALLR
jgi:hypothetical protein